MLLIWIAATSFKPVVSVADPLVGSNPTPEQERRLREILQLERDEEDIAVLIVTGRKGITK